MLKLLPAIILEDKNHLIFMVFKVSLVRTEISEMLSKETGLLWLARSALAADLTHHRNQTHLLRGQAGRADCEVK